MHNSCVSGSSTGAISNIDADNNLLRDFADLHTSAVMSKLCSNAMQTLHVIQLREFRGLFHVLGDEVSVTSAHSCRRLTGQEYTDRGMSDLLVTIRSWSSLQRISGLEATRMEPAACMYTMYGDGFTTLRALHAVHTPHLLSPRLWVNRFRFERVCSQCVAQPINS